MLSSTLPLTVAALGALVQAAPAPALDADFDFGLTGITAYAPTPVICPSESLVRPAVGLNSQEAQYIASRKPKANAGLAAWLKTQGSFPTSQLPSVGFASSGGGLRAQLTSAGVVKALDGRDSKVGTSGIYQGLTYESGLSGGSWFLSSLAANNWPTISSLQTGIWNAALEHSLLLPANLLSKSGLTEYAVVVAELLAKQALGYQTTIIDAWGRLLSYTLLYGLDGGVCDQLSGLSSLSNFTNANVPFPIMTALGNLAYEGQCYPAFNSTIYEFTTYEYGSWDKGVHAFANSKYMGSKLSNGKPVHAWSCTESYDNIGYIFGTSSDVFNALCATQIVPSNATDDLPGVLEGIVALTHTPADNDIFGLYPNPFYQYPGADLVSSQSTLTLSDGGESDQNIPIWPFIAGARTLDVLIASDNSADTSDNFPNGTEIHETYLQAQKNGHTRMPYIPDVTTFVTEGLNKRATFFGCDDPSTLTIIYLPNVNYTFPSNQSTLKLQYSVAQTTGMIDNGMEIATQNGDEQWPMCFACGIMNGAPKSELPEACEACFEKYCYQQ